MGFKNYITCHNCLFNKIYQSQQFINTFKLPIRYMGSFDECKVPMKKQPKKTCRTEETIEPEYFKTPNPCKTDEELKTERSLGVYMRCRPPYKPECMGLCFNLPRIDKHLYKPSKSLDRKYQKYWVDCVIEKRPSRPLGTIAPPELRRRRPPKPRCGRGCPGAPKCRTLMPMKCRPLRPAPATQDTRCIKFPLCECAKARENTRCRIRPKTITTCKRQLTRYPSFSECKSPPFNQAPITECLKKVSVCEQWRAFRNRHG